MASSRINQENHGKVLNSSPPAGMLVPEVLFGRLGQFLQECGLEIDERVKTQDITLYDLTRDNRIRNNRQIEQAMRTADIQRYARIEYYGDVKFVIHTLNAVDSKLQNLKGQGPLLVGEVLFR